MAPVSPDARVFVHSSDRMPELETGSVRLLFESPPFEKMTQCCGQPECLSSHSAEAFAEQFSRFLPERLRVLANDGNYVLNFQPQVLRGFASPTEFLLPMAVVKAGFKLVQTHPWAKLNAAPFAPDRRLKNSFEYCWHFAKTDRYVFNKDAVREAHAWADRDHRSERYNPAGRDPGTVFFLPKAQDQTSLGHPGKMAEGVASRFIRLLTNPGDLIVDGFVGTAQTGLEALTLGRRFVGFELHADRATQARERLEIKDSEDTQVKEWMNTQEVATYTGLATTTIYSKVSRGEMPVHHIGRLPRFHKDEIDAWIRGTQVPIQPSQDSASSS